MLAELEGVVTAVVPSTQAGTAAVFAVFKLPPVQAGFWVRIDLNEQDKRTLACTVLAAVDPFPMSGINFRAG